MEETNKYDPRLLMIWNVIKTFYCCWLVLSLLELSTCLITVIDNPEVERCFMGIGTMGFFPMLFVPFFTLVVIIVHYTHILKGALTCWRYRFALSFAFAMCLGLESCKPFQGLKLSVTELFLFYAVFIIITAIIINCVRMLLRKYCKEHKPYFSQRTKTIITVTILVVMQLTVIGLMIVIDKIH